MRTITFALVLRLVDYEADPRCCRSCSLAVSKVAILCIAALYYYLLVPLKILVYVTATFRGSTQAVRVTVARHGERLRTRKVPALD